MAYVTKEFYADTYRGEPVSDADFPLLCRRAEEIVEEMTMYRLTPESFASMPDSTKERIQNAVCAEIEYLDANGGADMENGGDLQSASLGRFSYTKAAGSNGSAEQSIYAPRARRILFLTGLLYRGGGPL